MTSRIGSCPDCSENNVELRPCPECKGLSCSHCMHHVHEFYGELRGCTEFVNPFGEGESDE